MIRDWNSLVAQLRSGVIGRREFLAAAAALGASGTAIGDAFAQTPKRGGHLIIGSDQGSTTDSLDPALWGTVWQPAFGCQLYDTMTVVNEKMQAKPSLAESWEFKPGAKEWIFKIRKGVTFHDGKPLTPEDVVFSINRHRDPKVKTSAKSLVTAFTDMKVTGPNEVTISLSGGNVDLPYLLADWKLQIGPADKVFDGNGTGAFKLESFEPGVRGRAKRNTNDWRQDRGYVDSVETLVVNDPGARVSALLSGTVHIINTIPTDQAALFEKNPQIKVYSQVGGLHGDFVMMADAAPYNNLDLRLALKYAIDREAVLKTVLKGYGKIGNDHPVPSYDPMYAADIPQRKYDPDQAKFHLKKSGYTGPIVLTFADSVMNGGLNISQIFQASAKKAGIDMQLDRQPMDGYISKYFATHAAPFWADSWGGRPTADLMLTAVYSSTSAQNESQWKSEKFDQLLVAARAEADVPKRKQMYHDLQMMLRDEAATVIPAFFNFIDGARKNIGGYVSSPVQQFSGYRAAEKVWFNS